jgi:hypothetical protein
MSQTSQPDPPPAASDIPAVADLPAVVHVPAANDLPATGDNPAASGLPASGDLPATGDLPASGGLPAAGDTPAADPYALAPVLVGFAGRLPQRRATVLIRIVLALPQLVVLSVIGLVSLWVAVAGWFAALVTGRLPQFAGQYLTGFVRWQARLLAYLLFLTDAYPPFTFEDADYPVRLYTRPVRLNRAAVLFRLVLALPAAVLGQLATAGLIAWSCVVWLIALIGGIVPEPLYQAIAATIRFNARYSGYALLLSATYPSGLFGDEQRLAGPAREPQATAELPATPEPRPNPEPRPAPEPQPNPEPGASDGTLPASPPVPAPQGAVPQPGPADPWALVLSGRAKALVAVCVASGLLLWAG